MSVKTPSKHERRVPHSSSSHRSYFSGVKVLLIVCCGLLSLILFKSYELSIFESRQVISDLFDITLQIHTLQKECNVLKKENTELKEALLKNTAMLNELKSLIPNGINTSPQPQPAKEVAKNTAKKVLDEDLKNIRAEIATLKMELGEQVRKLMNVDELSIQHSHSIESIENTIQDLPEKYLKLVSQIRGLEKSQDQIRTEIKGLKDEITDLKDERKSQKQEQYNESYQNHHQENKKNKSSKKEQKNTNKKTKKGYNKHKTQYHNIYDRLDSVFDALEL